MLFNSFTFIFAFLPVAVVIYFFLNRCGLIQSSKTWIVLSSLFFYGWWNPIYVPLIVFSIVLNYLIAQAFLEDGFVNIRIRSRRKLLLFGLTANVALLIYYKYLDFFIFNTNFITGSNFEYFNLALPLAISFFTLQQVAFLIDSYEGLIKRTKFIDYMVFVTFFPQLIAGPIVHFKETMPQFADKGNHTVNARNLALGISIFSIGLFKKVVLADQLGSWASTGFDDAPNLNFVEGWATSLSYTFQLYFDFSGYADMAIGAALLFNIRLPINFNSPYRATGIIEFWQRWHITLSRFITAYLYTPMVRSVGNPTFLKVMGVTVLTFLIVGLWHGASWMYVIFGATHGAAMVINHCWKKLKIKMNMVLAWVITFNFLNLSFVVFRAENWEDANKVYSAMVNFDNIVLPYALGGALGFLTQAGVTFGNYLGAISGSILTVVYLIFSFIIIFAFRNSTEDIEKKELTLRSSVWAGFCFVAAVLSLNRVSEFLYFNF